MKAHELEWETRWRLVEPKLTAQGWTAVRFREGSPLEAHENQAVAAFPTNNGPADYALCGSEKVLGVVEAKKLTLGPKTFCPRPNATPGESGVRPRPPTSRLLGSLARLATERPAVGPPERRNTGALRGSDD